MKRKMISHKSCCFRNRLIYKSVGIILTVFLIVIIFDGETLTSFDKDELILKRIVDRVS